MVVYYCKVHSDRFGISLSCVWKESMSLTVNYKINILKSPKFLLFCKSFINCSIKRIFKCHVLKTGNLFNFICCLCMFCTLLKGQLLWQICKTSSKIGGCYLATARMETLLHLFPKIYLLNPWFVERYLIISSPIFEVSFADIFSRHYS